MMDVFKYIGVYKEWFDDFGKGKGVVGCLDKVENIGYVGNYKGQGMFDKKQEWIEMDFCNMYYKFIYLLCELLQMLCVYICIYFILFIELNF